MSRRVGIVGTLFALVLMLALEWSQGVTPDPFGAPDPIAWGSSQGGSGAICTFAPDVK